MKVWPIGTIVKMKEPEGAKRMIIGYFPNEGSEIYDYITVSFPGGLLWGNEVIYINSDRIDSVDQMGYEDKLFERVKANIESLEEEIRESVKAFNE